MTKIYFDKTIGGHPPKTMGSEYVPFAEEIEKVLNVRSVSSGSFEILILE